MTAITYSRDGAIYSRFIDHVKLGLSRNIQDHQKNLLEKAGDTGAWVVEKLPGKVWSALRDPRVLTIAFTALALLADSYAFYPAQTHRTILHVVSMIHLKEHLWAFKFAAYILSVETILSYASRAYGRFSNNDLMTQFYTPRAAT